MVKKIISANYKFMCLSPEELLDLIAQYADGLELAVDHRKPYELNYLERLVDIIGNYDLRLQIHGDSELPIAEQRHFLDLLSGYADKIGQILVTLHPIYDPDIEESQRLTEEYFRQAVDHVRGTNVKILIENLNDDMETNQRRLKLGEIAHIQEGIPGLDYTYDLGHVIADGASALEDFADGIRLKDAIVNAHIHTTVDGIDHQPFYDGDKNIALTAQVLPYLDHLESVVFEYNLYKCRGETIKDRIIDYLQSMKEIDL